jgi:RpiB/LacA/LacB family sugar-phosphate isomerase
MRIAVGSDHAGFELKAVVARHMADAGHDVIDLGTDSPDISVDYPDFGLAVGQAVADGRADRGICVCGTGIGIGIAANKVVGIRAALVHDVTTAGLARRHNNANVICLGGRTTGSAEAIDAVDTFFTTDYEGGRHQRRLDEIAAFEQKTRERQ